MARRLTVIMPVYNEEESIRDAVGEIVELILSRIPDSELLAVDDGSRDSSPQVLDDLARHYEGVRVEHKPNGGHGDAVRYGLDRAEAEYLLLVDSDRQIPIEDFYSLWKRRGARKVVWGIRMSRKDPFHRLVLTRLVRLAIHILFGRGIRDGNVPFKLVHRAAWEQIAPLIPPRALTPSLFLAIAAAALPCIEHEEIPVSHRPRITGQTVLRPVRLAKFCARAFGEMLKFRQLLGRARGANQTRD